MKYAGRDPYGRRIVGKFVQQYSNGITIEYPNGVIEFINTERVIGPVPDEEPTYQGDLFQ